MDSAPTDGQVFLAFVPHSQGGYQFVCTHGADGNWRCMMSGDIQRPTHWRLLPESPKP